MRFETPSMPAADSGRRGRSSFSPSALALCALALAGCLAGPAPSAPPAAGGSEAVSNPDPHTSTRTGTGTGTRKLPTCDRVWSHAAADSVWDCPDPKPPAPVKVR